MKKRAKQCKLITDENWGERVSEHHKRNKNSFWKEVNGVRKKKESMEVVVKDAEQCEEWEEKIVRIF